MTTNHLTAPQRAGGEMILGRGRGWGYGMSAFTDTIPGQPAVGSFGWIGGYGSSWNSDPSRDLTMILLTQHEFSSASGDPIHQEFQHPARQVAADRFEYVIGHAHLGKLGDDRVAPVVEPESGQARSTGRAHPSAPT